MQTVPKQVRPYHCFRVVIPHFWRCKKVRLGSVGLVHVKDQNWDPHWDRAHEYSVNLCGLRLGGLQEQIPPQIQRGSWL